MNESSIVRSVLCAMITDDDFLSSIVQKKDQMTFLFANELSETLFRWCEKFYNEYGTAPKAHIRELYDEHVRTKKGNKTTLELIEKLLLDIDSNVTEDFNSKFLLSEAEKLGKITDLKALQLELEEAVDKADLKRAEELLREMELCKTNDEVPLIRPFHDKEAVEKVFAKSYEPLFHMGGAFGDLVDMALCRDNLLAIIGPEKRGKSWILMEFVMKALMARCNVAVFQVGDMTDSQYLKRIYTWMAQKPMKIHDNNRERTVPVLDCLLSQRCECILNDGADNKHIVVDLDTNKHVEKPHPEYKPCIKCAMKGRRFPGSVWKKIVKEKSEMTQEDVNKWRKIFQWRTKGRDFRMCTYPNSTINVTQISRILKQWKKEGYVPDVVVIDYADILAPEDPKKQPRDQQDDRWKALRRLSQEFNLLCITATQANRDSYTTEDVGNENVSDDKRKLSHSTGVLGLHQTPEEKVMGILRIGWLMLRDEFYDPGRQAVLLQDLAIGKAHTDSYMTKRKVEKKKTRGRSK